MNIPSNEPKGEVTEMQAEALQKYSLDGPFLEPIVRCDACQELQIIAELRKVGTCTCGNTRVRNVTIMQEAEMAKVEQWAAEGKIDPVWLRLFSGVQ